MILLNDANTLSVSYKTETAFSDEGNNKNLWKQALEKSGLYPALDAFKVVRYNDNLIENSGVKSSEVLNRTQKIEESDELTKTQTNGDLMKSFVQSETKAISDYLTIRNEKNTIQLNLLNRLFINQKVLSRSTAVTQDIQVANTPWDTSYNLQWLKKNVVATLVDSNVEVWIRDASLTEIKSNKILENIKKTMGELGASLSTVTINGKVTFKAKQ